VIPATLAPSDTAAVRRTAPTPVATAQPIRAITSSGAPASIGIAPDSGTTTSSANDETDR